MKIQGNSILFPNKIPYSRHTYIQHAADANLKKVARSAPAIKTKLHGVDLLNYVKKQMASVTQEANIHYTVLKAFGHS